jgi:hypothetical protein
MANRIKQGFREKLIELSVAELLPTKNMVRLSNQCAELFFYN